MTAFTYQESKEGLLSLRNKHDQTNMEWVKEGRIWGRLTTNLPLEWHHEVQYQSENVLRESITIKNPTDKPIFSQIKDIRIELPFPDEYLSAEESLTNRCHTHIWCGENSSYVLGLRMNGQPPHLGLVIVEGGFSHYSVERDYKKLSNDRGIFFLHTNPLVILPGEEKRIVWDLIWTNSAEEFHTQRLTYPNHLNISMNQYVLMGDEEADISIQLGANYNEKSLSILLNNQNLPFQLVKNRMVVSYQPRCLGEHTLYINYGDYSSHVRFLVYPDLKTLKERRLDVIHMDQQYRNEDIPNLKGAYLSYDNEDEKIYYSAKNDYNGGRERMGMGVAIAQHLKEFPNKELRASLAAYLTYVEKELFDCESGEVYDDYQRTYLLRLYNYPWLINLFEEAYYLTKDERYVYYMEKAFITYYEEGGASFYPIGHWFSRWIPLFRTVIGDESADYATRLAEEHIKFILLTDLNYPSSEVNYEQSIVAPAAQCLLEMAKLTGDLSYLEAAKKHMAMMTHFEGNQPDYHLNNVAIRHWDGYWFGKWKLFGDTFPHYWSGLNGMVYLTYYELTGDYDYLERAERSIRGCYSLIHLDGKASCAYIYPYYVNKTKADAYDPLANDQDWVLYFASRLDEVKNRKTP